MKGSLVVVLAGWVFGIGLGLAGMTRPEKVVGFLDFSGQWDPSLGVVMAGAVGVHFILLRVVRRRRTPLFDSHFHLPTRSDLDVKLVGGAAIFGIGWGLGGYCPGPGIVAVARGTGSAFVFVVAMAAGMLLQHLTEPIRPPAGSNQETP